MKYLGGKHQNGKYIANILNHLSPPENVDGYLEPFCGSLGVFKHMTNYKKSIASDIQPDLIKLWNDVKNNKFTPPKYKITDKVWENAKKLKSPNSMKAFIGFGCSFGGVFFIGNAQKYDRQNKRDFRQETINSINKIKPLIQKKNILFKNKSYDKYNPKSMLIYCDPPYIGTTKYKGIETFNHDKFWKKMREWSKDNIVVISEENAPKDFICIWEKKKRRTLLKTSKTKYNKSNKRFYSTEKLFIHKSLYKKLKKKIKEIKLIEINKLPIPYLKTKKNKKQKTKKKTKKTKSKTLKN